MSQAISWFKANQMVANPSKFQVMLMGLKTNDRIVLDIGGVSIDVVNSVKLLGVTIDSKLKFGQHVTNLCQKANNKISAFSRISNYLNQKQSLLLYNSFTMSQFNYCSLIWMFCGKVANDCVNRTHKRALRILFNDFTSSFEELLQKANQCTIHRKNLQKLMVEVYNSLTQQNPSFLWDMFQEKINDYNLRSKNLLMLPQAKTTTYGNESLYFRGSSLWNSLPNDIKTATSVCSFKKSIKTWSGEKCRCKICNYRC